MYCRPEGFLQILNPVKTREQEKIILTINRIFNQYESIYFADFCLGLRNLNLHWWTLGKVTSPRCPTGQSDELFADDKAGF